MGLIQWRVTYFDCVARQCSMADAVNDWLTDSCWLIGWSSSVSWRALHGRRSLVVCGLPDCKLYLSRVTMTAVYLPRIYLRVRTCATRLACSCIVQHRPILRKSIEAFSQQAVSTCLTWNKMFYINYVYLLRGISCMIDSEFGFAHF